MADPKWDDTEELEMSVPSFDDTTPVSFDDTMPIEDESIEVPTEEVSQLESGLRGAGQGLSFGLSDELAGATDALLGKDKLKEDVSKYGMLAPYLAAGRSIKQAGEGLYDVATTDKTLADLGAEYSDRYTEGRDESRAANKAAEEANPYTYKGSELAGGIASGIGTGGLAAGAGKLGVKGIAALTAAEGAATGAGYSEGDTLGEVAGDAVLGGVLGGALGGAGAKYGKTIASALSKAGAPTLGAVGGAGVGYATSDEETMEGRLGDAGAGALLGGTLGLGAKGGKWALNKLLPDAGEHFVRGVRGVETGTQEALDESVKKAQGAFKKIASTTRKAVDAAETGLNKLKESIAENEYKVAKAAEDQTSEAYSKTLMDKASAFSGRLSKLKDTFGKQIENAYKTIDDSPVQLNLNDVSAKVSQNVDELLPRVQTAAIGEAEAPAAYLNRLKETVLDLQNQSIGELSNKFNVRQVKNQLQMLINEAPDENVKRIAIQAYRDLNSSVADQLTEQGQKEMADVLSKANKGYSDTLELDYFTGNKGATKYASDALQKRQAKMASTLRKIQEAKTPEQLLEAKGLRDQLEKLDPTFKEGLAEIDQALVRKEMNIAPSGAEIRRNVRTESMIDTLDPEQKAAYDLESLLGRGKELTTGEVTPSAKTSRFFMDEAKGVGTDSADVMDAINRLGLADEADQAIKAGKEIDFQRRASGKDIESTGGILPQIIAGAGGLRSGAYRIANTLGMKIGQTGRLPSNMTSAVIKSMGSADNRALTEVAQVVQETAPEAAKKIQSMIATSDPIKRRAILFMLNQDPSFKKALANEEETEATEDKPQEMTFEGADVYGDWDNE